MKKIVLALFIIALCETGNAGFILGYYVGAAGAQSQPEIKAGGGQLLASDKHDVIVCPKNLTGQNLCYGSSMADMTPAQYTTYSGYKVLHKVGAYISDGKAFIVMEVSK